MEQKTRRRRRRKRKQKAAAGRLLLLAALLTLCFCLLRALDGREEALPENPLSPEDFVSAEGYVTCTAVPTRRGVDVSQYQQQVDWQQVYEAGFDFAFIRIGYRGNTTGDLYADDLAQQHLAGARAAGLDVGVYFYSQAVSPEEAAQESQWCLAFLEGMELELPVVYDWEWVGSEARTAQMNRDTLTACAKAFCSAIEAGGHRSMVYFNSHVSRDLLDLKELTEYPFWFAQYREAMDFPHRVDFWQYTETGSVPGIRGKVDINLMFCYE
jgi:GH25 family lysozyme M1 (1,4-beta-N-acetylmuramidase)